MKHIYILLFVFLAIPYAINAQDLSQDIISEQTQLSFSIPEDWTATLQVDSSSMIIELTDGDLTLELLTPSYFYERSLDLVESPEDILTTLIEEFEGEIEVISIEEQVINDRNLIIADYTVDQFSYKMVAVPLSNGGYIALDDYTLVTDEDYALMFDIASTIDNIPTPMVIENYDQDWEGVIEQLEADEIIASEGELLFEEDEAFFAGQGNFFTPLAYSSPQTNFVMAATLTYTQGLAYEPDGDLESCELLGRIQENTDGFVSENVEVGVDATGSFFYLAGSEVEDSFYYGEFARLPIGEPFHALYVVNGESLTVFLNGEMVGSQLPVFEREGGFGIGLDGHGPDANCVGENIWVYSLP